MTPAQRQFRDYFEPPFEKLILIYILKMGVMRMTDLMGKVLNSPEFEEMEKQQLLYGKKIGHLD